MPNTSQTEDFHHYEPVVRASSVAAPLADQALLTVVALDEGWLWKTPLMSNDKSLKNRWTRRWFYLKGFLLSYYRVKESLTSPEVDIQGKEPRRIFDLSSRSTVIRKPHWDDLGKKVHDARKFAPDGDTLVGDDPSSFLGFLIFVQIPEGKLCLRAETTEVAASWLSLFSRRLMQTSYVEKAQVLHMQPDKTVLKLLENPNVEHWDFKDCADTESLLIGLSDLLPSCSSVKSLSLANCKFGDKEMSKIQGHLATMSMSLKVALEKLDFSGLEILARNIWETGRPITAALQKLSVVDNGITDKVFHTALSV
ncbi:uncharacterized protein LOC112345403 [Selaginella moellendorffii]|uniref:uncharacterized protein LOC112345403 n=1 Tax=Selaginella moellendorffii TaxID=88036 RepID=UPI000D1C885D|nr:uncharacterized protein LOC112345403 [Selaginella moellendorffii]|eukprot:XP_024527888.1 uncharacterized protein LOC112345403 [Selaginella moellendorffii]